MKASDEVSVDHALLVANAQMIIGARTVCGLDLLHYGAFLGRVNWMNVLLVCCVIFIAFNVLHRILVVKASL